MLAASLLFACHPVHSEVVANLTSRAEVVCDLFCIAAMAVVLATSPDVVRAWDRYRSREQSEEQGSVRMTWFWWLSLSGI